MYLFRKIVWITLLLFFNTNCTFIKDSTKKSDLSSIPPEFVELTKIDPTIIVKLKYASKSNFVERPIKGYIHAKCLLTKEAADALSKAQIYFNKRGYSLKAWDCYRPQRAVNDFFEWSTNNNDTSEKSKYYPNIPKNMLFDLGYIAKKSGHSRGSTVDITIAPLDKNHPSLDMGTRFDLFDEKSHTLNYSLPSHIIKNREFLKTGMEEAGFINYNKEWWHFTLKDEPFPDTYFDFEII